MRHAALGALLGVQFGLCASAAPNLLKNGSFDDWPDGALGPRHWSVNVSRAADHIGRAYAQGTDGEHSLFWKDGTMHDGVSQAVAVRPGAYYEIRCDAKSDVARFGFHIFHHWEDVAGRRLKDVTKPAGRFHLEPHAPWTPMSRTNLQAPPDAARLVVGLYANDSWSNDGCPGTIFVDNVAVCEVEGPRPDDAATVVADPAVRVGESALDPKCEKAVVFVSAAERPVTVRAIVEEIFTNGMVRTVGDRELEIPAGARVRREIPMEARSESVRVSVWHGDRLVWRKANVPGAPRLAIGPHDPFGVRQNRIFIPNDARWYVNLPIVHNVGKEKGGERYCNSTNLGVRLFVETPSGVDAPHIKYSDWGGDLPVLKPLAVTAVERRGEMWRRIEFPVRVAKHNVPLVFFTSTLPTGTQVPVYVYLTWNGGRQIPLRLDAEIVAYGRVKPFERMKFMLDDLKINLSSAIADDPAQELPRLGVNVMRVPMRPERRYRPFIDGLKGAGTGWSFIGQIDVNTCIGRWGNDIKHGEFTSLEPDPESHFCGMDGKPQKCEGGFIGVCPLYRGRNFTGTAKILVESEMVRDYGVTWMVFDWEFWRSQPCFCDRCLRAFREDWCRKRNLPDFGDPCKFMAKPSAHPEAAREYNAFFRHSLGSLYADLRAEMNKSLDPARTEWWSPIRGSFVLADWKWPDKGLLHGLDYFNFGMGYYRPEEVMDRIDRLFVDVVGGTGRQLYCGVCPMQGCELCMKSPPISTYYNLLEAATLGVRGFEWYFAPIAESMTWKYVMDGLRSMRPYEDIILDGEVTVRGEGENCSWRRVAKNGESLWCVRNYALTEEKTVAFRVEADGECMVFDTLDGTRIATLRKGTNRIEIGLGPQRLARMVYVGTRQDERIGAARNSER